MKIRSLLFFLLLLSVSVFGQKHFTFTPEMKKAHQLVMSLRFDEARPLIKEIKQNDPENLMIHHVENYLDFFTCYISEEKPVFNKLEKNKDLRLQLIKRGDRSSPYYLYLQANIRLHWALARIKFEEYFTAFLEVNKAFKLLNRNNRKFPNFLPNKKDLGILHAAAGTIPDNYKWGVELLTDMKGDLDLGRSEIEEVMNYAKENEFVYAQETRVLYAYLLMHLENNGEDAWKILQSSKIDPTTNPLATFTVANIAVRTGRNDEAIEVLENRPKGEKYYPFYYLDYMLGEAKLRRLDADADRYFLSYVNNFKGRHFIKEAYQKLSWHALIHGDFQKIYTYNEKLKANGRTVTGGDKNADRDARAGTLYDVNLLKARLLFDGANYKEAFEILASKTEADFRTTRDKLEFHYRMGRIAHKLKRYPSAFHFYNKTLEKGIAEQHYFACNAALQAGLIHEELKNFGQAKTYFKKCLSINPDEYKTSLHQRAKSGLERLKRK